jgi:hypothetical protein
MLGTRGINAKQVLFKPEYSCNYEVAELLGACMFLFLTMWRLFLIHNRKQILLSHCVGDNSKYSNNMLNVIKFWHSNTVLSDVPFALLQIFSIDNGSIILNNQNDFFISKIKVHEILHPPKPYGFQLYPRKW